MHVVAVGARSVRAGASWRCGAWLHRWPVRARERAALAAVVVVVLATSAVGVVRDPAVALTLTVAFACVTLAVAAFLLRCDEEQRRSGLFLYLAVGCLLGSEARVVLGPAGAWIGSVSMWTATVPLGVVLLTYPGRCLSRRWHRRLLVAVAADFVVLSTVVVTLPLRSTVVEALGMVSAIAGVALPVAAGVALVQRWACAAAPERAGVRSVAVVGLALVTTFAARLAVRGLVELELVTEETYTVVRTVNLVCLALAPLVLLFEVLRRRAAHGRLVASLLEVGGDARLIEQIMRRAVNDPSLRLVLSERDSEEEVATARRGRISQVLRSPDGAAVAVVDADETTTCDPTQLRTVLTAGTSALNNARLQAQLEHRLDELQHSRARIVEATLRARRLLERDLHDGAQQQLLAVAATLARAELLRQPLERATAISEARQRLGEAIAELRRLARGIHPGVLDRGGLPAALNTLLDLAPVPIDVDVPAELARVRLSPPIEATMWFVASEAVTNAARHSGADQIRLRLRAGAGSVTLRIDDDGRGGARLLCGGGLAGLTDRVSALGGQLSILSSGTTGTRVEATLQCES